MALHRYRRWLCSGYGVALLAPLAYRLALEGVRMSFLDRIPYIILIIWGIFMGMAPFVPEPHLLEKAKMLADGTLTKPLDIFDLFWHLLPDILLLLKLMRDHTASEDQN